MSTVNYVIENGRVYLHNVEGKLRCQNCDNPLGIRNSKTIMLQTSVSLISPNQNGGIDLTLRCGQCKNLTTVPIEFEGDEIIYKKFDRKLNI